MFFLPFTVELHTRFRGTTSRSGVLLQATDKNGQKHYGEYSPFPDYDARRASLWWQAAWEAAHGDFPQLLRTTVPVNSIIPAVLPAKAQELVVQAGCRTAKVKVGGETDFTADLARVEAVAQALVEQHGKNAALRVDVNGAWSVSEAAKNLRELAAAVIANGIGAGLEYAEQPCASITELAELRRQTSVLIAADESIRLDTDPLAAVKADAVDIVVLKPSPLGGVNKCLEIFEQLQEKAAVPVVVSSAMESSVGLAAAVRLAATLPALPYACGLGTGNLLATDTVVETLRPVAGVIHWQQVEQLQVRLKK